MGIRDKYNTLFFSTSEDEIKRRVEEEEKVENNPEDEDGEGEREKFITRGDDDDSVKKIPLMADDPEQLREEIKSNRTKINETRVRLSKIDERTSYTARIVFTMFVAFIVTVAGGVLITLLF